MGRIPGILAVVSCSQTNNPIRFLFFFFFATGGGQVVMGV